ncbi:MAG: hypothetical protein HXX16_04135 [Bacteroidales bacterium]|nr:hypothetical protein [Bacteroidales bacterium]
MVTNPEWVEYLTVYPRSTHSGLDYYPSSTPPIPLGAIQIQVLSDLWLNQTALENDYPYGEHLSIINHHNRKLRYIFYEKLMNWFKER